MIPSVPFPDVGHRKGAKLDQLATACLYAKPWSLTLVASAPPAGGEGWGLKYEVIDATGSGWCLLPVETYSLTESLVECGGAHV